MALNVDADYVTVPEAARMLGVSPSTIWRWIDRGDLPAARIGRRRVRIRRDSLGSVIRPARPGVASFVLPRLTEEARARGDAAFAHLTKLREELFAKYGPMEESAELIREMREERNHHLDSL